MIDVPSPLSKGTGWPWVGPFPSSAVADRSTNLPRITIVTPNLNHGHFLEQCIRSVLLQRYPNVEYFVSDGGSTDDSLDICRHYEDLLSWKSAPDSGQSEAINSAWRRGSGEIYAWLNADDVLIPGTLYEVAREFGGRSDAGFIYGRSVSVDTDWNFLKLRGRPFDVYRALEIAHHDVAQPSAFIHQRALERVGLLDEQLHKSMDWDLWVRIAITHPCYFVPRVWSINRRWPGMKTSLLRCSGAGEYVDIVNKALAEHPEDPRLKSIRRRSLGSAFARAALACYGVRNVSSALRFGLKALFAHPIAALQRIGLFRRRWTQVD